MDAIRIDKWLWAVRLFKTRTQASDACRGGKIKIDSQNVKPSRDIKEGDEIEVQLSIIRKKVKVKQLLKNRVSAKLVDNYLEDLTPVEEYEKLQMRLELLESLYKAETQINEGRGISHEDAQAMVMKSIKD